MPKEYRKVRKEHQCPSAEFSFPANPFPGPPVWNLHLFCEAKSVFLWSLESLSQQWIQDGIYYSFMGPRHIMLVMRK